MNSLEALEELQLNYEERTEILNNNMPSDWLSHTWLFNKIKKDLEELQQIKSVDLSEGGKWYNYLLDLVMTTRNVKEYNKAKNNVRNIIKKALVLEKRECKIKELLKNRSYYARNPVSKKVKLFIEVKEIQALLGGKENE